MQNEMRSQECFSTDLDSSSTSSSDIFLESVLEAGARALAQLRSDWRRDKELIEAQSREVVAVMRAEIAQHLRQFETDVAERLNRIRDGQPGEPGRNGADGAPGDKGDPGEAGPAGPAGPIGPAGASGEPGRNGADGKPGHVGPPGEPGPIGPAGEPGRNGAQGERGLQGEKGERGEAGPRGAIERIVPWSERIFYEGELVTHIGASWQAKRDTAGEPGDSDDWRCIAAAGQPGASFNIRGTHQAGETYRALDVVTLDHSWFIARRDQPGEIPGPGWQSGPVGKRGEKGVPGPRGEKGDPGKGAPHWIGVKLDGFDLVAVMSDGTIGPKFSLRQMFTQFAAELQLKG